MIAERFVVISAPYDADSDDAWALIGGRETRQEAQRVAEIHATNKPASRFYVAELKTCSVAEARTVEFSCRTRDVA